MGTWRMRPPWDPQEDVVSCWKSAVSSFTRVTAAVPDASAAEVERRMKAHNCVNLHGRTRGGLKMGRRSRARTLGFLHSEFGLTNDQINRDKEKLAHRKSASEDEVSIRRDLISVGYLGAALSKSHVVLAYNQTPGSWWHNVVVYGVDNLWMCAMDPLAYVDEDPDCVLRIQDGMYYRQYRMRDWAPRVHDWLILWKHW
jgi:hypothetical protein